MVPTIHTYDYFTMTILSSIQLIQHDKRNKLEISKKKLCLHRTSSASEFEVLMQMLLSEFAVASSET
jgi:hypothetical protein